MTDDSWGSTHLSIVLGVRNPRDSVAWARFARQYRDPIVRYCQHGLRLQEAAAEDVAQEILVKLIQAMQRFEYDPAKSLRGWLKTVTRHAVLDYLKDEGKRLDVGTGKPEIHGAIANYPSDDDTEELTDVLSEQLQRDFLKDAEELVHERMRNEKNWQAYCLLKEGKTARDVAAELSMSVGAVYKAKSRVRQLLNQEVGKLLKSKGLAKEES